MAGQDSWCLHALGQVHSSRLEQDKRHELLKGQYDIAVKQLKYRFVADLRYRADVICSKEFVSKAFGKPAAKKKYLGLSLNARPRGGKVLQTAGRLSTFSSLQSGFPALPTTASKVPATVSLGEIKIEKASGDDEVLPMETEVLSVIAQEEDDPSTTSVFNALDEVGQFSVVDEVGQCEDTPLIMTEVISVSSDSDTEGRAPVEGTPTLVGVSNTGVTRVPVEAGNLAPWVISTQVFTNSSYVARECIPARKVLETIGVDQTRKSHGTDHAKETCVPLSVDGMYVRFSPFKPTCLPEASS
ncbi:hypothetical protein DPMN_126859 [Dreissena polymorpha]|uniref:Uncharacterized protein n=1 Tax=Dreissena polymorpha TaxID=45954 RepID=A0A9D4GY39_DREPO|nr:hypothetical protein DPMN_126859 [Dreissena polymorpha]